MFKYAVFFCITFLLFLSLLSADVISLKDSSVLSGEIVANNVDDIDFKTQFLGVLKVMKKDVDKIEITADNEKLRDDLEADTKYFSPNMVIWKHEKSLSGETRAVTLEEKKNQWLYRADFDWNSKNGNTNSRKVAGTLHAKYEDGNFRINTFLSGEQEVVEGNESQNNMRYSFQYEDKDEPHSWYSTTEARYDDAQNLEYRVSESLGYVHYLQKVAETELRLRCGGFVSSERFQGQSVSNPAGLDLGFYGYYIFDNAWRVVSDIGYKLDANDFDNYDGYHESYLEIPLDKERMWSLRLGLRHEYDNMVPEDINKLETRYYLRLSMGWFAI